jgi:antitoxin ParD1/3/4
MPTRVALNDQQACFVGELVRSGRFKDASEVVAAGLRLMEGRERREAAKLQDLRNRLDAAEQDAAMGNLLDYTPMLLDEIDAEEQTEYRLTHDR